MPSQATDLTTEEFIPTEVSPLVAGFGQSVMEAAESRTDLWPTQTVATFVYARVHNFAQVCQALAASELTSFVNEVRNILSEAVVKLGGEIAQRRPDSILAVFSNAPNAPKPDHAQRGLHAAL